MALRHFRSTVRSICTWRLAAAERAYFARYLSYRYVSDYDRLLKVYGNADGHVAVRRFVKDLRATGLRPDDPRLQHTFSELQDENAEGLLAQHKFIQAVSSNGPLIEKALKKKFVIPDFEHFKQSIDELYHECLPITDGENASYIPELARADPNHWGVSLCTVDGQRHSIGNTDVNFTLQSGGKCVSYAIAVDKYGADRIHQYIGKEPSGASFNSLFLNSDGKPHNPMINSGAIVLCSLINPSHSITDRVNFMLQRFCAMAGVPERSIKCDIMTCDSEMENAHRNNALMHYMMDKKVFPPETSLEDTLKFYTRLCSIELDCNRGAVMAATLANGGYCPTTGNKVLGDDSVRNTLTLMHSCGMYDSAGEFSFAVGLPAKSGVSGVILLVVPNMMGLCLFSPPVNKNGNSVRGLHFCKRLVETFNLHCYDSVSYQMDPRRKKQEHKELEMTSIMYAAHAGALSAMQRYLLSGIDLGQCNHDSRTPLHVAAAEGCYSVVDFLVSKAEVSVNPQDRWSKTPLDDALFFGHDRIASYLVQRGGVTGTDMYSRQSGSKT